MTLGSYLKEKRLKKNLSLRDIQKLGFDKTLMSKIENEINFPKADTLQQIAKILDINIIELYKIAGYVSDDDINTYINQRKVI